MRLDNRFDGDQMNFMLAIDNLLGDKFQHLAAHRDLLDLSRPRSTSRNISMPKPVVASISNWLHYPVDNNEEPEKRKLTESLAMQ